MVMQNNSNLCQFSNMKDPMLNVFTEDHKRAKNFQQAMESEGSLFTGKFHIMYITNFTKKDTSH